MDDLTALREAAIIQAGYYGDAHKRIGTESDEKGARHIGVRVVDFLRVKGVPYRSGTAIYRRARTRLERMVKDGKAVAWRPGAGAYVFYFPVGLAAELRATPSEAYGPGEKP